MNSYYMFIDGLENRVVIQAKNNDLSNFSAYEKFVSVLSGYQERLNIE